MALVGFKAQNHPQQQLFHGPRADVDERATPPEFFAVLDRRFRFTIDAAALAYNAKLPRYWTPADNGLEQDWTGERVWCNPPFSDVEPWVRKANGSTADLAVMLLPANRTEQTWWQEIVEPQRDRGGRLRTEFLPGRLRFGIGGNAPLPDTRPPFGCCLLIWGKPKPNGTCATCGGWLPGEGPFPRTELWAGDDRDDEMSCPAAGGIPCVARDCLEHGCVDEREPPNPDAPAEPSEPATGSVD